MKNDPRWLQVGELGLVAGGRVVAVGPAESAAMLRLLRVVTADRIVVLTGGRRRRTVLVLDSGHLVVTAMSLDEAAEWLRNGGPPAGESGPAEGGGDGWNNW